MRKRMKRYESSTSVRFITFSCQRRLQLLADPVLADVMTAAMAHAHRQRAFELFGWVLMPEHVHIMLRPAQGDTAAALLKGIKLSVAQRAIGRWKRAVRGASLLRHDPALDPAVAAGHLEQIATPDGPRFWQKGGGFDRNIRSMKEFTAEIRYMHENPVERGLVQRAEQWPWSSIHPWLARHQGAMWSGEPGIDVPPGDGRWDWLGWRGFMEWPEERSH